MTGRDPFVMWRVPVVTDGVVAMVYFGTATEAKKFAKEEAVKAGRHGFTYEALPRSVVADMLTEHVPVPPYFR